ncbi:Hypothetical_protein [Hexamita inflata]|uniref:Hypothetical_protein n=1 Tax=Hexamita inflata TaxID=28002 RepID=A0AA86U1B6_9EUKA|nr:Hypothetical protein HINF_LOCUS24061 [Hexamita inflata]
MFSCSKSQLKSDKIYRTEPYKCNLIMSTKSKYNCRTIKVNLRCKRVLLRRRLSSKLSSASYLLETPKRKLKSWSRSYRTWTRSILSNCRLLKMISETIAQKQLSRRSHSRSRFSS